MRLLTYAQQKRLQAFAFSFDFAYGGFRQLEWPSASQTAQQLTAEGVYLDQSRTLHDSEKSICHQAGATTGLQEQAMCPHVLLSAMHATFAKAGPCNSVLAYHELASECMWHAAIIPSTTPGANDSRGAMRAELLKQAELAKAEAFQKVRSTFPVFPCKFRYMQLLIMSGRSGSILEALQQV